jgi:hypothetical protein
VTPAGSAFDELKLRRLGTSARAHHNAIESGLSFTD